MKYNFIKILFALSILAFPFGDLQAQDGSAKATVKEEEGPKIRFNGLGRTLLTQTGIDGNVVESDTSTIESLTDGEFLLDLAVNASPNKTTEVQTIIRLRNEFGGFFGSGISVEVRELWARGVIADVLKYRVGDMDVAMTPYTLFNFDDEGTINEPAVFAPQRELVFYEQFYTENNTRRLQGGKLDFGLDFAQGLRDMDASAFIARIRGTDFFTVPTRIVTGGQLDFSTATFNDSLGLKADVGFNFVHTFDDLRSGDANQGIRNTVFTADFDVAIVDKKTLGIHLTGETGMSNLETAERVINDAGDRENVTLTEEDDTFLEIGAKVKLKEQNLTISAAFVDVGPDFFSVGAQSKRIDFEAEKEFYNRIGTDRGLRGPSLFDFGRDRGLYTFRTSDRLMAYDPRFSNTMPYGNATPNRRGVRAAIQYGQAGDKINASVNAAFLEEIRGQGTFELKNFSLIQAAANVNIHKFASWEKKLRATLGLQLESTSRDGQEIEQVDLTSNLIELGLEAELFADFEILLGAKIFSSEGTEYIPLIETFNDVKDFPAPFVVDNTETLLGAGLKYNFKKDIYITLQYNTFSFESAANGPNDYDLNQFFVLYNMKF
ncbi:MAG: hypothetical protein AAF990_18480 [Bacteroidota bacterium]